MPAGRSAWLPPESPLAMPVQSLGAGALRRRAQGRIPLAMGWRRVCVIGVTAALTLMAAYQIWWLLRGNGIDLLEGLLLLLFVGLFAWIAQSFVSAVAGFICLLAHPHARLGLDPSDPLPVLTTRTALLMPTYNEDPERLLAGLRAIHESVTETGLGDRFDFFVLSDTTLPQIAQAEIEAVTALRAELARAGSQLGPRLYYRRRDDNIERKAGNIADWVRRFGAGWAQMLILDADSLMSGETVVRLVGAMEAHPDVALIQTFPMVVGGHTLFARMQQFSGRVYGPVVAHGIAWWQGPESNYWGHNAIIRTAAFAAHAGLPELRGLGPFRGTVLSHDFVEAALLRRGGWALYMVPSLGGSYEEGPPSLTDMLVRDRRWCQGNLQHGAVLPARGLHWVSRWHLLIGIGQYFTAPMWALLMLVGLAIPVLNARVVQDHDALATLNPTRYWREQDPERFVWVFVFTMAILLAPKLLGFVATLLDREQRRGCGGVVRISIGMLMETVVAALMAPVTMYAQSRGVVQVLAGRDSGWEVQRRDDGSLPLSALLRSYGVTTLFGCLLAVAGWIVSPMMLAWMSPVIAGLVLSIPIVALTSSPAVGHWLKQCGIFRIPEEVAPPPVLARASELRARILP